MRMVDEQKLLDMIDDEKGVLRLVPTWVPRDFLSPGMRLRLDPRDIYALGASRGGIDERWLASVTKADNPGAPADEGMSYVLLGQEKFMLSKLLEVAGQRLVGKRHWDVLAKLFDNASMIPLHLHQTERHARAVGRVPKPEAYYFPPELNADEGSFPYTFFGLSPGTTKDDLKRCLAAWDKGDNGVLYLSQAYKLKPGTGWLVPAGLLHAPGTMVTYEVQKASDVSAMYQNMLQGRPISWDLLVKDVPAEHRRDLDYIVDMVDWETNVDPELRSHHFMSPLQRASEKDYSEFWVVYGTSEFSATRLTLKPASETVIRDSAAYGVLAIKGHGTLGGHPLETTESIRYGELTADEYFVAEGEARDGVLVKNESKTTELVLLKHFASGNPEAPPSLHSFD